MSGVRQPPLFELESLEPRLLLSSSPVPLPDQLIAPNPTEARTTLPADPAPASSAVALDMLTVTGTTAADDLFGPVDKLPSIPVAVEAETVADTPPTSTAAVSRIGEAVTLNILTSPDSTNAGAKVSGPEVALPNPTPEAASQAEVLADTLRAANGPPVTELESIQGIAAIAASGSTPSRPLLLIPGIGGTFAKPEAVDEWYVHRGIEPEKLQIDPLTGVYDDLIKTLKNVGYVEGQTLFIVNYDWRMAPGPIDGTIDGVINGLTPASLTDSTFQYGVDYLGYFLKQASDAWKAAHGSAPADVDLVVHSTGGLIARNYIQSTAYNGDAGGFLLPKVHDLLLMAVPDRGASKAWNPLHDDWDVEAAFRIVLSKILDNGWRRLQSGEVIHGPDGDITRDLVNAAPNAKIAFTNLFCPTIRGLLATYPFLDNGAKDAQGNPILETVNSSVADRNNGVLDLNDGLDLYFTIDELNASPDHTVFAQGRKRAPDAFVDKLTGNAVLIYDVVKTTPVNAARQTGPAGVLLDPLAAPITSFSNFYGRLPAAGETWYTDVKKDLSGDGTVPTVSSIGQFQGDPRALANNTGKIRLYAIGDAAQKDAAPDHTGIMYHIDAIRTVLLDLGFTVTNDKISQGSAAGDVEAMARVISLGILDPLDIARQAGLDNATEKDAVKSGLGAIRSFGAAVDQLPFMTAPLPVIGSSLSSLIKLGDLTNGLVTPLIAEIDASAVPAADVLRNKIKDYLRTLNGNRSNPDDVSGGLISTGDADLARALGLSGAQTTPQISELVFRVPISIQRTLAVKLDFGDTIRAAGLKFSTEVQAQATVEFRFDFSFGYDLRAGIANDKRFFIRVHNAAFTITLDVQNLTAGLNIGFFGAEIRNGTLHASVGIQAVVGNPDNDPRGNITAAELSTTSGNRLLTFKGRGALAARLPLSAKLGNFSLPGTPEITVESDDLFSAKPPRIGGADDIKKLFDFRALGPDDVIRLLDQFCNWLDQFRDTTLFTTPIPFVKDVTLGKLLDLKTAAQEFITKLRRATDGKAGFGNAQELANQLAQALGLPVDSIAPNYDAATRLLTFHIELTKTFTPLSAQFDFDRGYAPLAEILGSGLINLTAQASLKFTFGLDLQPLAAGQTEADMFAKRFFIAAGATVGGSVTLSATNVNASARFGDFISIDVVNGSGSVSAALNVAFKDPGTGAADGRITLPELTSALLNPAALGTFTLNSSAKLRLPIEVNPHISGTPKTDTPALVIDSNDITNLPTLVPRMENGQALLDIQQLNWTRILDALHSLADYLGTLEGLDFLKNKLPLVNKSPAELLGMAADFARLVDDLSRNPAQALQFVEKQIEQIFRLPDEAVSLTFPAADQLRLSIDWKKSINTTQPIDIDLADLAAHLPAGDPARAFVEGVSRIVQVSGAAQLQFQASAELKLDLGIEIRPAASASPLPNFRPFIYDTSLIAVTLKAGATNIDFNASAGSLGIFVKDGSAQIIRSGSPLDESPASLTVALKNLDGDGRHYFGEINLDSFQASLNAAVVAKLPVYFPTASNFAGNLEFRINSLADFFAGKPNSVFFTTPDFRSSIQNFDFLNNLGVIIDGVDFLLAQIQHALDSGIFDVNLPLVGDGLANASREGVRFIENLRTKVLAELRGKLDNAVNKSVDLVRQALFSAFGPTGLKILADSNSDGQVTLADIDAPITMKGNLPEQVQFNMVLRKPVEIFKGAVGFDIGLPALGLSLDGGVDLGLDFELNLRFGVSRTYGFYLDTSVVNELKVAFTATIPNLHASGRLGFLQVDATDNAQSPSKVTVSFAIDFKDPFPGTATEADKNRLTFDDLVRADLTKVVTADFSGAAHVSLDLVTSFGGDAAFPSLGATLVLDWSFTSKNNFQIIAPTVAFNNVRLNVGEFVTKLMRGVLGKVRDILAPLDPIVQFLNEKVPGISELLQKDYRVIDLIFDASNLSKLPGGAGSGSGGAGTGDDSQALQFFVKQFVKMADLLRQIDNINNVSNLWIPIGSFSFGNNDIRNVQDVARFIEQTEVLRPLLERLPGFSQQVADFVGQMSDIAGTKSGFKFPILDNPSILFQLLLGKDVSLVEYALQPLTFDKSFEASFPLIGPVVAYVNGGFKIKASLEFGYDTRGIRQFIDSRDPVDLINGFFISDVDSRGYDRPELTLWAGLNLGIKADAALAKAGAEGGITGNAAVDLRDPDHDGRVHFDEFVQNLSAAGDLGQKLLCTFNMSGNVKVFFRVYAKVGVPPIEIGPEFKVDKTIFSFDTSGIACSLNQYPDRFDPGYVDRNGTRDTATLVGTSPGQWITGVAIGDPNDIDFYKFELLRPDSLDIRALFKRSRGDLKIVVTDSKGTLIGRSKDVSYPNQGDLVELPNLQPGIYFVQVRGSTLGNPYDFVIEPGAGSSTRVFYVNDADTKDQFYTLAAGKDTNDARTPTTPKATLAAVFRDYDLNPGDIVVIDTGAYAGTAVVGGAEDEGFILTGAPGTTTLNYSATAISLTASPDNIFTRLKFAGSGTTAVGLDLKGASDNNAVRGNVFDGGAVAIRLEGSGVTVEDNVISNTSQHGILLAANATGTVRRNKLTVSGDIGVEIDGAGQSSVEDNNIAGARTFGIVLAGSASGVVKNNIVAIASTKTNLTGGVGIQIDGPGDATIEDNTLSGASLSGILIKSAQNAFVRRNTVGSTDGSGLSFASKGALVAEDNSFTGATDTGILMTTAATSKLVRNQITIAGSAQGIHADTGAHQIEFNTISGRGTQGIYLTANATLSSPLTGNTINLSGATHGIRIETVQPVTIEVNTVAGPTAFGILVSASTAATIRSNKITLAGGQGIHLDNGANTIESNTVSGTGTHGIYLTAGAALAGPLHDNAITLTGATHGIRIDTALPVTITDNTAGTASVFGIYLANAVTSTVLRNTVTITGTAVGIRFEKGTGQVDDNTILGTGDYGIYLTSTAKLNQGSIRNNKINNGGNHSGIRLDSPDPVLIENNQISGQKLYGIFLPASTNATIRGNTIATGYGATPIRIESGVSLIEKNIVQVNASNGFGIDLAKTATGTLRDNTVTGGGVRLVFGSDNVIENNRISGSRNGYNIHMLDAAGGRILGNVLAPGPHNSTSGGGILVTGPVKIVIENNQIEQAGIAISLTKTVESAIRGNRITAASTGITVASGSNVIENNVIEYRSEHGISLDESDTPHKNLVRNNVIRGDGGTVGNYGIYIRYGDNVVENNTIEATLDGMSIGSKSSTVIRGNKVLTHTRGIRVLLCPEQLVENNTVIGVDAAKTRGDGIEITFQSPGISSIVRQNEVTGFLRGITTNSGVNVRGNRVHDNATGMFGSGIFGNPDGSEVNDIYANDLGIDLSGEAWFNRIHDNKTGISVASSAHVYRNQIYRNSNVAVLIDNKSYGQVLGNTIYAPAGDGVRVLGFLRGAIVKDNIIVTETGYGIVIDPLTLESFTSDYNLFFHSAGSSGKTGSWKKADAISLADWQAQSGGDANSLFTDPLFVNAAAGDFSLKSGSPAIDRADAWYSPRQTVPGDGRIDDPGTKNTGRVDYVVTDLGKSLFTATGTARNWKSDDTYWGVTLPFTFPFFDVTYTGLNVTTEGAIVFPNSRSYREPNNSTEKLVADRVIAPLWDNLRTSGTGDDIFTDATVPGQFTVRWNATSVADGGDVNFSITLFQNGRIRFDYGPGNANLTPTLGISLGNGIAYALAPGNGAASLAGANSVEFALRPGYTDLGAAEYQGSVFVNGGAQQRSLVSSVGVNFTSNVAATLGTDDLLLTNQTTGLTVPASSMALRYDTGSNRATLTFPGLAGGHLADGVYRLTLRSAGISDASGTVLDADLIYTFRVLTGDANGDGRVNQTDLYQLWQTLLKPASTRNPGDDLNGDGKVDSLDLDVVRKNYLRTLP